MLLTYGSRTCNHPSPYVDMHGTDGKSKVARGRPLHMDARRYQLLLDKYSTCQIATEVIQKRSCSQRVIINGYF